jgi:hypothetical protein
MPGQNYSEIAAKLVAAGLVSETPCAIISRATTRHQRTHRTTITDLTRAPQLAAPTLLVVGEVARFADPVVSAQEFLVPTLPSGIDSTTYAAMFVDSKPEVGEPDFTTNEEPVA